MFASCKFRTMKHISVKILYILFTTVLLISCQKDDDSDAVDDLKAENRKSLGTSAEDLLSDDIYTNLVVELVYSGLYKPTDDAVNDFRNFLNERLNKPGSITFIETQINESSGAPFTVGEIQAIEDENRTRYTDGNTIAVYVFFSNGSSSNDTNTSVTLGTAYMNTSIVVYEKTLKDIALANPQIALRDLESTTLQHEFGHILGLVNIQDDDIHTNHEDPAHNKHCVVEECLMYFESNLRSQVIQRFSGRNTVAELDPLCIEDLQAKGGL